MPKPIHLKPLDSFSKLSDRDLVQDGITIQSNMTGKTPTFSLESFL